jgi:hypothetical protein
MNAFYKILIFFCLLFPSAFSYADDQSTSSAINQRTARLLERHWDQPDSPPIDQNSMVMGWMAAILAPGPSPEIQQSPAATIPVDSISGYHHDAQKDTVNPK